MASKIYYKWAFQEVGPIGVVNFSGQGLRLHELKQEIISLIVGPNGPREFDLEVVDSETNRVFTDEYGTIPMNSTVLISRLPLAVQSRFDRSSQHPQRAAGSTAPVAIHQGSSANADDFQDVLGNAQREATASMSEPALAEVTAAKGTLPPRAAGPRGFNKFAVKDGSGTQGGVLKATKKNIGIPKGLLSTEENQGTVQTDEITTAQKSEIKTMTVEEAEARIKTMPNLVIPDELRCSISHGLLKDAVILPCCLRPCSHEVINEALVTSGMVCPLCGQSGISPDQLRRDKILRDKVKAFVQEVRLQLDKQQSTSGPSAVVTSKFASISGVVKDNSEIPIESSQPIKSSGENIDEDAGYQRPEQPPQSTTPIPPGPVLGGQWRPPYPAGQFPPTYPPPWHPGQAPYPGWRGPPLPGRGIPPPGYWNPAMARGYPGPPHPNFFPRGPRPDSNIHPPFPSPDTDTGVVPPIAPSEALQQPLNQVLDTTADPIREDNREQSQTSQQPNPDDDKRRSRSPDRRRRGRRRRSRSPDDRDRNRRRNRSPDRRNESRNDRRGRGRSPARHKERNRSPDRRRDLSPSVQKNRRRDSSPAQRDRRRGRSPDRGHRRNASPSRPRTRDDPGKETGRRDEKRKSEQKNASQSANERDRFKKGNETSEAEALRMEKLREEESKREQRLARFGKDLTRDSGRHNEATSSNSSQAQPSQGLAESNSGSHDARKNDSDSDDDGDSIVDTAESKLDQAKKKRRRRDRRRKKHR